LDVRQANEKKLAAAGDDAGWGRHLPLFRLYISGQVSRIFENPKDY